MADTVRLRAYAALPFALLSLGLLWLGRRVIEFAQLIEGE